MREIESALAVDTYARGFHSGTNSTKEDVRTSGQDTPVVANPMNSRVFRWCRPCNAPANVPIKEAVRCATVPRPSPWLLHCCALPVLVSAQQPAPDFSVPPTVWWDFEAAGCSRARRAILQSFIQRTFTVDRKDFNAPAIGMDVEFWLTPRTEHRRRLRLVAGEQEFGYRDFVDNQRLPITQIDEAARAEPQRQRQVRAHAARTRNQQSGMDSGCRHALRRRGSRPAALRVAAIRRLHRREHG